MRWALPLLIVVVLVAAVVASLMPNPKATAEGCPGFCPNLGLDLVGGQRGEYRIISTDNQAVTPEILNQTRTIIENRVNFTGVAEANVQTQGGDRITVGETTGDVISKSLVKLADELTDSPRDGRSKVMVYDVPPTSPVYFQ